MISYMSILHISWTRSRRNEKQRCQCIFVFLADRWNCKSWKSFSLKPTLLSLIMKNMLKGCWKRVSPPPPPPLSLSLFLHLLILFLFLTLPFLLSSFLFSISQTFNLSCSFSVPLSLSFSISSFFLSFSHSLPSSFFSISQTFNLS